MRFLTALVLSITFATAGVNAAEHADKGKRSRGKSFLRSVSAFGGSMILTEPYQEVRSSKKAVKPQTSMPQSTASNEALQPRAEKTETPQAQI